MIGRMTMYLTDFSILGLKMWDNNEHDLWINAEKIHNSPIILVSNKPMNKLDYNSNKLIANQSSMTEEKD